MLNEEKVILMTRIAIYKESLGREDLEKGKYFQSDYVKLNCLKTIVSSTVLFLVVTAAYVYYNIGSIMETLTDIDYLTVAGRIVALYAIVCVFFVIFAWLLYTYRYVKAKPKLIKYNQNLKKLIEFYDREDNNRGRRKRRAK
jgi:uncharacterized membrane protein YciS (DUF1049 family)